MTNETTASQPMQELVRDLYNFEGGRHFALRLEKMLASQPPVMVAEPVGLKLAAYRVISPNTGKERLMKKSMAKAWDRSGYVVTPLYEFSADAAPMVADPAGVAPVTDNDAFMAALDGYMDAVDNTPRNSDRRISQRLAIFSAAEAWKSAATVKAVPSEALDEAPIECWSADQEDFIAQSIGELCDRNEELKPGDTVWVGEAIKPEPSQLIDADDIVTIMGERAYDLVGEHADGYPDVDKEAEQELNTLLAGWIGKHARPNFWTVANVKPYVLSADDFAAPLADKTGGGE